mgnify:CR=1 FL=1
MPPPRHYRSKFRPTVSVPDLPLVGNWEFDMIDRLSRYEAGGCAKPGTPPCFNIRVSLYFVVFLREAARAGRFFAGAFSASSMIFMQSANDSSAGTQSFGSL